MAGAFCKAPALKKGTMADISEWGTFLNGIAGDIFTGFKTFNAPGSLPVPGTPRPDQAQGPRSTTPSGTPKVSMTTILVVGAVAALIGAFVLSVMRR
jgi:hypothetical protein